MTHLYFGDPNEKFSLKLAQTLIDAGADALEIGIPYTDPVCDGGVFQRACRRALENGITPIKVLEGVKTIRERGYQQPIYLTSYFAPIFKMGMKYFVKKAKESGIDGLIIPDIVLEEQGELKKYCQEFNLPIVQFATVYSGNTRLQQICQASTDFVYCVSLPGVTGDETESRNKLRKLIESLKLLTDKKLFVGFGIKSVNDAKMIIDFGADGVIIGSVIARIYEYYLQRNEKIELSLGKIAAFIKSLKQFRGD